MMEAKNLPWQPNSDGTSNADSCCRPDNPQPEVHPSVVLLQPAGPLQRQNRLEHFHTGLHGPHLHLLRYTRRSETSPDTLRLTMLLYSFNMKRRSHGEALLSVSICSTLLAKATRVSGKILGHTRPPHGSSLSLACNNSAQQKHLIEGCFSRVAKTRIRSQHLG